MFGKLSSDGLDCACRCALKPEPATTAISEIFKRSGFMMDDTLFLFLALADDIRLSSYNICFISRVAPRCQSETFRNVFFYRVHDHWYIAHTARLEKHPAHGELSGWLTQKPWIVSQRRIDSQSQHPARFDCPPLHLKPVQIHHQQTSRFPS